MMRGIHIFRRDRTTQVISCNLWSTKLCPYPSLIQKMKTYLGLEGKLGPKCRPQPQPQPQTQSQPHTSTPCQSNNSLARKTPGPTMAEKKRRTGAPVKWRYKVMVIAQPLPLLTSTTSLPMNPILTVPTTVTNSTACTQTPMVKSAATTILVTVYNFAQGKFEGIPNPTGRPQAE